jgi:hypothetical protein
MATLGSWLQVLLLNHDCVMQDRERGVVWEETIIFCPQGARMVFLSATLSNAAEFAGELDSNHDWPQHYLPFAYAILLLLAYHGSAGEVCVQSITAVLA